MMSSTYVEALRDLQYRLPAKGEAFHGELVGQGHAVAVLADAVTADDFHALTIDNALALEHGGRSRVDDDRRTGFILGGICRSA